MNIDPIKILLADDDKHDRYFFNNVLSDLPFNTELNTVQDGAELMDYLNNNSGSLPDVLFLDLNMPRKNGAECLTEIKNNAKLRYLPVIIYSTSLNEDTAGVLHDHGAHFYIRKTNLEELSTTLQHILTMIVQKKFVPASKENFILNSVPHF
jgi:CheY-like chemotaxis protein